MNGTADLKPQVYSKATTWRKRSRQDGIIDWRMSADSIYNLVRALTKPYSGAEFTYKNDYKNIWGSSVCFDEHPEGI